MFSVVERVDMVRESLQRFPNVEAASYTGLTVDFCRRVGAHVLVRGLRALSDFEWEYQQSALNRKLNPEVEVIAMFASIEYGFLSSSIVKEIAENGGDVSTMVPEPVNRRLRERLGERSPRSDAGR